MYVCTQRSLYLFEIQTYWKNAESILNVSKKEGRFHSVSLYGIHGMYICMVCTCVQMYRCTYTYLILYEIWEP